MRALVQRVREASVCVGGQVVASIGSGLLTLVGLGAGDGEADVAFIARKVCALRIFEDDAGKMARSVVDVGGHVLLVSQFTLYADVTQGNRPSFTQAMAPTEARQWFERTLEAFSRIAPTHAGVVGADMAVSLVNDGPVTVWLDSRGRG